MDLTNAERPGALERPSRIDPRNSLNEIVEANPATLPVLDRFGFDTCCGGSLTLEAAARSHGVDLAVLRAALEEVLPRGS